MEKFDKRLVMEEAEEEEQSKTDYSEKVQQSHQSFQTGNVRTMRVIRTTIKTSSSTSNVQEVVSSKLTNRITGSLDEDTSSSNKSIVCEPKSLSTSSLNKTTTSPDRGLKDEVTIQELGKGEGEKKVYRATAMLDLGKTFPRPPVIKSDSIKEEGQDNVVVTEPDDSQAGSIDRSEDSSYPMSDELTKSSHEDLPKGLLVAEDRRHVSHSAFQALSRSHGSLDETKVSMVEQKSVDNLLISGRKQVLKGGILEEEATEISESKGSFMRSSTGQENRQQWLTADTGATNVNSRSMESLREHRASFITSSEKDVRRVLSSSVEARSLESLEKEVRVMGNRYRRAVSGEEVVDVSAPAEKKRGLFASCRAAVPSHLSLMPPQFVDRRLTILSPHSPMVGQFPTPGSSYSSSETSWQFSTQTLKTRRKKAVVLPRLVLPGSDDPFSW